MPTVVVKSLRFHFGPCIRIPKGRPVIICAFRPTTALMPTPNSLHESSWLASSACVDDTGCSGCGRTPGVYCLWVRNAIGVQSRVSLALQLNLGASWCLEMIPIIFGTPFVFCRRPLRPCANYFHVGEVAHLIRPPEVPKSYTETLEPYQHRIETGSGRCRSFTGMIVQHASTTRAGSL